MIAQTFMFYNLTKKMKFCLKLGKNLKIKKIKIIRIFGIDIYISIEMKILSMVRKILLIGSQNVRSLIKVCRKKVI